MSMSLLNAAGLEMCEPGSMEDGTEEQDAYGLQDTASQDEIFDPKQIPCPWSCNTGGLGCEEDLHAHLKQSCDNTFCPILSRMVWDATTRELLSHLSQLIGIAGANTELSPTTRLDPNGRFYLFTSGLILARSVALQLPMFVIPQTIARFMWEWATTDRPDSPSVVNSFQNKLQHQPTMEILKMMHSHYRPSKFYITISKGKHGKSEKIWRPLHEWMLDECLNSKYIFFKLDHTLRKAGDSVMVVLVVSKKVAICFDPKCMTLEGEDRNRRDAEVYSSIKRLLNTLTKKFQRNLLKEHRKQWEVYMEQELAVYVYASPWLEQLVKQVAVDPNEFVFEMLVLAFYYRCAMQEASLYQEGPADSIPVPTFFLEAVSDVGCLLTDAMHSDGKPTDTFWRELIEWSLNRSTYETLFASSDSVLAQPSELLNQSAKMGKTPQIASRLQMASMEHEFRLVEPPGDDDTGDHMEQHEGSPDPNAIQDGITDFKSPAQQKLQSLLRTDMVTGTVEGHHTVGERSLRPVAARKANFMPVPVPVPGGSSGSGCSSNSKRKSTVPSKSVPQSGSDMDPTKRHKPDQKHPMSMVNNSNHRGSTSGGNASYDYDQKHHLKNGHHSVASSSSSGSKKPGSSNSRPSFNMPAANRSGGGINLNEHKFHSEILAKLIQPKPHSASPLPYECLVCDSYGSADLSAMKDHIREHMGMSPYECYHCHKGFTCVRTFKAHADVLGIPYFRCIVCPWQSDEEGDMHRHLQDEHLELPKCRREDLHGLLQFYKVEKDFKSWDDYIASTGKSAVAKSSSRLETVMNGNGSSAKK